MEVRRVHISSLALDGESATSVPVGAIDENGGRLSQPMEVNFRTRNGIIVPYVALDYSNRGKNSPIKEIVLGPKNENLESNIQIFLNAADLGRVTIRRSRASYR